MFSPFLFDLSSQVVCATSTVDASLTVPQDPQMQLSVSSVAKNLGSLYFVGVAGSSCYLNIGAAATSANILMPIGVTNTPWYLTPGTVIHALTPSSTGQLWIVRARIL